MHNATASKREDAVRILSLAYRGKFMLMAVMDLCPSNRHG
jgi:hypothetical protein